MPFVSSLLIAGSLAFAGEPSVEEQQAIIAKVRAYAQSYDERLQNFTCIRTTARSVDTSGSGTRWKELDTQEQELTYVAHKESYRLLKITGTRAPGYTTMRGEFQGLPHLFDARARTEFTWDRMEGPTCVLRYHATLESGAAIHYNKGGKQGALPHHGLIYADCSSGTVSRLLMETDPGKGDEVRSDVGYGAIAIGGREFVLPISAEDRVRDGKKITRAQITFTGYRKYDADSVIHFDREN